MNRKIIVSIASMILLVSSSVTADASLELTSSAFSDGDSLPISFTCEGEGISPPLSWRGVPEGAQSLVVIMDHQPQFNPDPQLKPEPRPEPKPKSELNQGTKPMQVGDGMPPPPPNSNKPEGLRWYWTMYNIPTDVSGVDAGKSVGILGSNVVTEGNEYASPCSKGPGPKKYTFHLYALSDSLAIPHSEPVSEATLRKHMSGIVLDSDSLTVSFTRSCRSPSNMLDQPRRQPIDSEKDHSAGQAKHQRPSPSELPLCSQVEKISVFSPI
ncbi:YbhB/YbcL family Raf kinase inhibitor-like protein [Vibrio sp. WJH972]